MLDHIGLPVGDFARSKDFYVRALAPLGFGLVMEVSAGKAAAQSQAGFGPEGRPHFWIGTGKAIGGQVHFAFAAKDRAAVHAFYDAALAAGGKDNGPPGVRPQYHANYYGAFVLDPDGHNIEAVCHLPE
jgi:catechol 2,3-dioxygenase-like lactoylglutathione lyase family enzyme